VWVSTKKYGRVSKVLEKRNKIRYCKVALHIISYYTIKFDIILIAYYIDANNSSVGAGAGRVLQHGRRFGQKVDIGKGLGYGIRNLFWS